ncbi:helix-turn-helix transcriptional regulator [Micromonospora sp. M12]
MTLAQADRSPVRPEDETFHRFRREVEHGYPDTRRVEDYAAELRCSVRTLTRACLAVTGRSAKQVIDERVALQASRLLAATDQPIAQIGRHLGFSEPTNFGRFFTREVGVSPARSGRHRINRPRPGSSDPARRPSRRAATAAGSAPASPANPSTVATPRDPAARRTAGRDRPGMMAGCRSPRAATTRYGRR